MTRQQWSVRVRTLNEPTVTAPLKGANLRLLDTLSFDPKAKLPCSLESALASYGADLVTGFKRVLNQKRVEVFSIEADVKANLENPMVHIGVVGEFGSPRINLIRATLYVTANCERNLLETTLATVLERSPLHQTLIRATEIQVRLVSS